MFRAGDKFPNPQGHDIVIARVWEYQLYFDLEVIDRTTGERGDVRVSKADFI